MRGTRVGRHVDYGAVGIIPAYAGNTFRHERAGDHRRDHPRVCGEHMPKLFACAPQLGSSPRMRGTLKNRQRILERRGIIPAYAGNTVG